MGVEEGVGTLLYVYILAICVIYESYKKGEHKCVVLFYKRYAHIIPGVARLCMCIYRIHVCYRCVSYSMYVRLDNRFVSIRCTSGAGVYVLLNKSVWVYPIRWMYVLLDKSVWVVCVGVSYSMVVCAIR